MPGLLFKFFRDLAKVIPDFLELFWGEGFYVCYKLVNSWHNEFSFLPGQEHSFDECSDIIVNCEQWNRQW